jgi:anti-anti-sigma factor
MEWRVTEELGKTAVVSFSGNINVNDEPAVIELVRNVLLPKGFIFVIFDLSGVDYVDSAGMGSFLAARSVLNKISGELALAAPSHKIEKILSLAGFNKIFKIFGSVEEAKRKVSV